MRSRRQRIKQSYPRTPGGSHYFACFQNVKDFPKKKRRKKCGPPRVPLRRARVGDGRDDGRGRCAMAVATGNDGSAERMGALVRGQREKRELSLGKLAARSGVSVATLSKLERGQRSVTLDLADRVL